MKLSMMAGYSPAKMSIPMDTILEAENLGFDCVWTAEAYGSDAVSPAAWVLAQTSKIKVGTAIMQMPARAPAMTAMTAMTLDALSGGRFVRGLGPSGPQVVEGWYGVPYGKPLTRTREYIKIVRDILKREGPLTHEGEHYSIPNTGPGTTGFGKPLKNCSAFITIILYKVSWFKRRGVFTSIFMSIYVYLHSIYVYVRSIYVYVRSIYVYLRSEEVY